MKQIFVISLGGSLIVPKADVIDTAFLKSFYKLIINEVKKGNRFIIVTGGGKVCRVYQDALRTISRPSGEDLDWMGIYATELNAQLLRLIFKKQAEISKDVYYRKIPHKRAIIFAGGHKPGQSSDGAMIKIAVTYGAKAVINLSNIDYVYTKDPRKFKDAKKIKKMTWDELLEITGSKWDPGKNVPFDPTAAKLAKKNKISVIIANGKNLKNLKNILSEKKFLGTIIN